MSQRYPLLHWIDNILANFWGRDKRLPWRSQGFLWWSLTGKLWELKLKVLGANTGPVEWHLRWKKEQSHSMFMVLKFLFFYEEHRSLQTRKTDFIILWKTPRWFTIIFLLSGVKTSDGICHKDMSRNNGILVLWRPSKINHLLVMNAHKGDKVVTHNPTHGHQHGMLGNVSNPLHSISPIKLRHH